MNKKPRVAFTIYDKNNEKYAKMMINSLRKFHSEEELPIICIDQEKLDKIKDPFKFYRMTPFIAKDLIKDYELVIKLDCDQIIMGDLKHIFDAFDNYDVGTVLNINRVDPPVYGLIGIATVQPNEYYNCGLVAMRSEKFINHWWKLCTSEHFDRMPMREQGFLNILCHYGDYKVRCFDRYDPFHDIQTWNGLIVKGEENKAILKSGKVVLPRGADNYPDREVVIKAWHTAGGGNEIKLPYHQRFNEDVIEYIDYLVGDANERS